MLRLFLLLFCLCSSLWAIEVRNFMVFQNEVAKFLTPDERNPRARLIHAIARHVVSGFPLIFDEMVIIDDQIQTPDGKLRLTMWEGRKMFSVGSENRFLAFLKPTDEAEVYHLQEIHPFLTRLTGDGLPQFIVPRKAWDIISEKRTSYCFVLADVEIAEGKSLWELYKMYTRSSSPKKIIEKRTNFFNGMFATTKALATFHVRSGFLNTQNTQENSLSLNRWICLCHGDANLKNIFVTPAGKVTLIDWENAFKSLYRECHPMDEMEYFVWVMMCYWGDDTQKWPDEDPNIVPFEIYVPFWKEVAHVYSETYARIMRERYSDFLDAHQGSIFEELINLFGGILGRDHTFRIDSNPCLAAMGNPSILSSWQQCLRTEGFTASDAPQAA